MKPAIGTILDDKYRIVRELGTGGMGAVYEGENVRIHRKVAIKLLHASVSSQSEAVMRFEREAKAAGRIGSDHICEVLDLGILPDNTRYLVMEYLEGETLGVRIKRSGRMGPLMTIPLIAQVLDALSAAHAAGIVHRDLKPDNIFILPIKGGVPDFVKILDFGVSKFAENSDEMNMTRAGAVVGTPYYMSPEQARGTSQVDARSDIYALGVLLYQATTGQVPFQAQTFNELLFKIVLEPAPPPQQYAPDLDPEFSSIIQKAMAREPQHRFQSCAEFKEALLTWMEARVGPGVMPGGRPNTIPPSGGLRAPTPPSLLQPPSLHQSQPSWAVGSASGGQAPSSGPWQGTPPPSGPGTQATSGTPGTPGTSGAPTPQTGSSWGNASQSGQIAARPQRSGLAVGAITAAAIALVGGGGLAIFFMGKTTPAQPPTTTQATQPTAVPSPTPVETAAPAPVTAAPTSDPAPVASAAPTSTAEVAPTGAPTASPAPEAPNTAVVRPAGTGVVPPSGGWKKPTPTPTAKPTAKPVPGDFGY
ncbi:MAG TPA: protein kinase [Polyangiaceae bacterium]|nr:protein kinase [Polyangiaceae bacterium]